jgi:hypothetical protein
LHFVFIVLVPVLCLYPIPNTFAVFFNEDFQIVNFGLKNGNPFIDVHGKTGHSFSTGGENETYYAYIFVTVEGKFSSIVALDDSGAKTKPSYGVNQVEVTSFRGDA